MTVTARVHVHFFISSCSTTPDPTWVEGMQYPVSNMMSLRRLSSYTMHEGSKGDLQAVKEYTLEKIVCIVLVYR